MNEEIKTETAESETAESVVNALCDAIIEGSVPVACDWNAGNYSIALSAKVTPSVFQTLANLGLLWCGQRNSDHDRVIGLSVKDAKGIYRRTAGKTRADFAFDGEVAKRLAASYGAIATPKDAGATALSPTAVVTEYIRDVAEPKFESEREAMARHESMTATAGEPKSLELSVWLKTVIGYAGESHGPDGEFSLAALRAIRAYVKALEF